MKKKSCRKYDRKYLTCMTNEIIIPSKHAIDRYMIRSNKKHITLEQAKRAIIQQVSQSFLIKTFPDGTEQRSYYGNLYIIKREKGINFSPDKLIIITIKLSKIRQKERFSDNFTKETIDYKAFDHKRACTLIS